LVLSQITFPDCSSILRLRQWLTAACSWSKAFFLSGPVTTRLSGCGQEMAGVAEVVRASTRRPAETSVRPAGQLRQAGDSIRLNLRFNIWQVSGMDRTPVRVGYTTVQKNAAN
jgi:hypothetical protein